MKKYNIGSPNVLVKQDQKQRKHQVIKKNTTILDALKKLLLRQTLRDRRNGKKLENKAVIKVMKLATMSPMKMKKFWKMQRNPELIPHLKKRLLHT